MAESVHELLKFIQIGARLDLKAVALEHILSLTGTNIGIETLLDIPAILISLITLLDDNSEIIAKYAALCLINISSNERGAEILVNVPIDKHCPPLQKPPDKITTTIMKFICNPESNIADPCCMILSNLTRPKHLIEPIIDDIKFEDLINILTKINYNKKGAKLDYLGPVLSNLSQSSRFRRFLLDSEKAVIQRLLPFTQYKESVERRGGVVGTLKNCCFESDFHDWLLGEQVDILPRLLLPLAGNEEFDEEDNDKLPLDLQYLPKEKRREEDPDIRCILLEALTQLCMKRHNRQFIRDNNTYVILRELHKWEKDKKALLACENLVDILIRTEDEIGEEDLGKVEVPQHLQDDFIKADEDFLKEN